MLKEFFNGIGENREFNFLAPFQEIMLLFNNIDNDLDNKKFYFGIKLPRT